MPRNAAPLAAALLTVVLSVSVSAARRDSGPQPTDLSPRFAGAGLVIREFQAFEIGGVVVLRGRANDLATAQEAGRLALSMGFARIANLVQVAAPPDDVTIQRKAERELSSHRSLDGCRLSVSSAQGVVNVEGQINNETQKDTVLRLLRNIDGVREVRASLVRR